MADLFWLSDEQWTVVEAFMPKNQSGPERKDDRQVIPGIDHVVKTSCRWCDCPPEYGPPTMIYTADKTIGLAEQRPLRRSLIAVPAAMN